MCNVQILNKLTNPFTDLSSFHFNFVWQFMFILFILEIPPSIPWDYAMFMWEKCRTVELYTVYSIQYTRYRAPPVCSAWPRMKEGTEPGAAPSKAEEKVSVLRAVNRTSRNFTMLALLEAPTSSAFCFLTYQETVDYKPEQAKAPWPWPLQEDRQCWLVGSSNKEKALGKAFSSHYETAKSRWQL